MVYFYCCLIFSKEYSYIDDLVEKICYHNFELKYEYQSITGLLGIDVPNNITGNDNTIKFIISCHMYHILEFMCVNYCTPKDTVSIQTPIGPDIDGANCKETYKWKYSVTVGMLHYLSRNAYSVTGT